MYVPRARHHVSPFPSAAARELQLQPSNVPPQTGKVGCHSDEAPLEPAYRPPNIDAKAEPQPHLQQHRPATRLHSVALSEKNCFDFNFTDNNQRLWHLVTTELCRVSCSAFLAGLGIDADIVLESSFQVCAAAAAFALESTI